MNQRVSVVISPYLVHLIEKLANNCFEAIRSLPPEAYIYSYLNVAHHLRTVFTVGEMFDIGPESKILEVGSGIGVKCLLGNAIWGAHFTGVEPCRSTYEPLRDAILEFRATNAHARYTWVNSSAERLSLPAQSFDLVLSFETIEHVQNPGTVLFEMYRLLKPGGRIFISTCNYNSFFEGHYEVLWFPILRHVPSLAKWWVKAQGRNPAFLSEVNYITRAELMNCLQAAGFRDIKVGYDIPSAPPPTLSLKLPPDFHLERIQSHRSKFRPFIENSSVHSLLSRFGMEYKLYVKARKI